MSTIPENKWINRSLYPFKSHYVQLHKGTMHYVDEGCGDPILFVHGSPTWSFLYRDFIKFFSKKYRCLAVDHIGFGLSEKPMNFKGTPEEHAQNLSEFINLLDLKKITLVVHDFGGPIGLGTAIENYPKIKQVVLFNTWLWGTKDNPNAIKINNLIHSLLGKFLYLHLNFSPKILLKKGFANKKHLTPTIHQHYLNPFPNKNSRLSLLKLAESLVGSSDWYDKNWNQLHCLLEKPWLILWGMKDNFITPEYLHQWKIKLPHATSIELDAGHFVQEECPEEAINHLQKFLMLN